MCVIHGKCINRKKALEIWREGYTGGYIMMKEEKGCIAFARSG